MQNLIKDKKISELKRITITLTEEEKEEFIIISKSYGLKPAVNASSIIKRYIEKQKKI